MATGQSYSDSRTVTLTPEEKEFALSLQRPGQTQKEALDEYAKNKLRLLREKMAGLHG
jgi:hypothetical protein